MNDPFDLQRFVHAQQSTIATALAELHAGRKVSHWMWFVFPQLFGLGRSATAVRYAIGGRDEARAYLAHPVLGPRLHESVAALLGGPRTDPVAILGAIDAAKLRSSMTLFAAVGGGAPFAQVLTSMFGGEPDPATLRLLDRRDGDPSPP